MGAPGGFRQADHRLQQNPLCFCERSPDKVERSRNKKAYIGQTVWQAVRVANTYGILSGLSLWAVSLLCCPHGEYDSAKSCEFRLRGLLGLERNKSANALFWGWTDVMATMVTWRTICSLLLRDDSFFDPIVEKERLPMIERSLLVDEEVDLVPEWRLPSSPSSSWLSSPSSKCKRERAIEPEGYLAISSALLFPPMFSC